MQQNTGKHARFMLEKRQRVPATAVDDEDEDVSTIPVATTSVRGGRQPLPTADPDDEETPTSATTTRGRVPLTTSDSSASLSLGRGGGRTTAEETTTTPAATSLVFTPSSTSSSTSSTTPRTTSRTSSSSTSTRATTSSTSLSSTTTSSAPASVTSGITNNADTANQTNKDGGGSNTGAIAGAVIGVLVLLAVAAFFGLRYRKKKKRQAEDAAIFNHGGNNPGGAAGLGASAFGKRQSAGYNQHVDSNEDLPSGGNNGNGYGYGEKEFANVGEKQHSSGMAGYGTLALNSAANGNNNNFNGFSSPSHAALLGRDSTGNFSPVQPGAFVAPAFPPGHHDSQDRFSNFSNGYPHSVTAGDGVAEYPPTVAGMQQNPHASMQSFASNSNRRSMGPSAAMMAHPQDNFNSGSSQLPPHQDHALASALNRNSGSAYPAEGVVAAAAAQNVPLPLSPATATRQSMNSVATAAAAAALGNQPTDDGVDGPFGDPSHEGKIYIVTRVFEPSMPDELVFYPGDRIQVVVTYDDGWCLGCNLDSPQRDGKPPARGVFPRDCVEELTAENEAAFASRPASQATVMGNQTPVNFDEDRPIASGGANLQRAPTLPPLDMGNSSRFSMGSAAAARQSEEQARMSKRFSTAPNAGTRQSRAVAESDADDEMDDAYGGVTAVTSATPTRTAFPPEIQVSSSTSPPTGMATRRASHQFGSTQHIADYASQLEQQQQAARRLSTLDEESNSHMTDEFPSTPRTAHPDSPQVSHLVGGNRGSIAASPAGSAARLSIAGLPKSSSATSIKRTSSLIASKDADLFLAFGDLGKDGRQQ